MNDNTSNNPDACMIEVEVRQENGTVRNLVRVGAISHVALCIPDDGDQYCHFCLNGEYKRIHGEKGSAFYHMYYGIKARQIFVVPNDSEGA